ncbi:MAG: ChrR family anti-sigma-E factor [Rhodospirillaceae bacterium]
MNANHHPADDILLSYAAGSLDEPTSILIATHLALCPLCRQHVSGAETVGGELLNDVEPVSIEEGALESVLARLDEGDGEPINVSSARKMEQNELNLPRPLSEYIEGSIKSLPWRWLGPGVHYTPLAPDAKGPKAGLLRIAPGTRVPMHGHSGQEYTMVLSGGYTDMTGNYQRGDVEAAEHGLVHQPVADVGEECVCLVVTEGTLQPTGFFAKVLQPFFRI